MSPSQALFFPSLIVEWDMLVQIRPTWPCSRTSELVIFITLAYRLLGGRFFQKAKLSFLTYDGSPEGDHWFQIETFILLGGTVGKAVLIRCWALYQSSATQISYHIPWELLSSEFSASFLFPTLKRWSCLRTNIAFCFSVMLQSASSTMLMTWFL